MDTQKKVPEFRTLLFSTLLKDLSGLARSRGGQQLPDPLETLAAETKSEPLRAAIELLEDFHPPQVPEEDKLLEILSTSDVLLGGGSPKGQVEGRLETIFSSLRIYESLPPVEDRYYEPGPVRLAKEAIFPTGDPAGGGGEYEEVLKLLREDFAKVGGFRGMEFPYVYEALRRRCKFVPARGGTSLFDRAKTLCAVGSCLFRQLEADRTLPEELDRGKTVPLALIHGDLSGVQDFIYSITSKYALKTLKGRSLYLSLLTDNLADYLLERLELSWANLLFAGGGHLYILSHRAGKERIGRLRERINGALVDHFGTGLYLALDAADLEGKDLEGMADKWREAAERTGEWKERKFSELMDDEDYYRKIMRPKGEMAGRRCTVCGSRRELEAVPDAEEGFWCRDCRGFRELAEDLKRSDYLRSPDGSEKSYNDLFERLGGPYEFSDRPEGVSWKVNSAELGEGYVTGTRFIPKGIPVNEDGSIKDLDHLAAAGDGVAKIGAIKMDVDSLGRVFTRGLEDRSITRLATLSSSLSLFFKGYLSRLIEDKYSGSVYLVYSGGDDTFALGHWGKIIEFGWEVYRKFREYTAFNPHLTLSAGVVVVDPKLPVSRSAEMAEGRLDRAKYGPKLTEEQAGNPKNRICLFGKNLSWDWREADASPASGPELVEEWEGLEAEAFDGRSEFELARLLKGVLVWLIEEKEVPRGLLGKLKGLSTQLDRLLFRAAEAGKIDPPELWRVKYVLRDYLNSSRPEVRQGTDLLVGLLERTVRNNLFKEEEDKIDSVRFVTVATRWAELLTREE